MNKASTGIDSIFELAGASREARAYSFLYASFKRTEVGNNPVRDAIDCLVPFIIPYARGRVGSQVTASGVQEFMKKSYGFDLPLYAIDQLFSAMSASGIIKYNKAAKVHLVAQADADFDVAKAELEDDFDSICEGLEKHALRLGFDIAPPSGDWGKALLNFLKERSDRKIPKLVNVKNALLDPQNLETAIVGGYINNLHKEDGASFEKLLRVFMGTLIEDFLASIAEVGTVDLSKPVVVFYDTSLLLRQLGSSVRELRLATHELTRYLQDLGFTITYFPGNEAEVAGIIDTIIHKKDSGQQLEGETAVAIAEGHVTMTDIRAMQNVFPEKLAQYAIFPQSDIEKRIQDNAKYQINEAGLAEFLKREAKEYGRFYGDQNSQNDASYIGSVMRLRRRLQGRDLADCGFIFVTGNRFLAIQSRRYLIKERQLLPQQVPPVLAVGQLATICWLLKDHTLPPEQAGKELLANCYAAIRPDAEWFKNFKEGLESVVGSLENGADGPLSAITLQAARRIAQDESFSSNAVVRQLNMAEIIQRAKEEEVKTLGNLAETNKLAQDSLMAALKSQEEKSQAELATTVERSAIQLKEAVRRASEETSAHIMQKLDKNRRKRAEKLTDFLSKTFVWFVFAFFLLASIGAIYAQQVDMSGLGFYISVLVILPFTLVSTADYLGLSFAKSLANILKRWLTERFYRMLG